MRVLFVLNEVSPLYKLGGLGDVGQGLSKALFSLGVDLRLCIPYHPEINVVEKHLVHHGEVYYDHQVINYQVFLTYLPNSAVPVYLINDPKFLSVKSDAFDKYVDKAAVFSSCVADFIVHFESWPVQLLHLHDWHVALVPLLLTHQYNHRLSTLLTIHNHRYNGTTSNHLLAKLSLPVSACQVIKWDNEDQEINLLLEGIIHADAVSTVSVNYRQELLAEASLFGDIVRAKAARFFGITNGIDTNFWDPTKDPLITSRFTPDNVREGKRANKQILRQTLGFSANLDQPLITFIGRLDPQQKGLHLILEGLGQDIFPPPEIPFILLGTGDPSLETSLHQAAANHPLIRIITRYDEALAHQLYAGSDLVVIPSDYEPCGLVQLIAMRYGTLPIAHKTGGLTDTIRHGETGVLYHPNGLDAFTAAVAEGLNLLASPSATNLTRALMREDVTWDKAASRYLKLYTNIFSGDIKVK